MRKIIIAALALVMAVVPSLPVRAENTLLNGQKHYYTVQLRSDKRAIVYARIIFQNGSSDQNLTDYKFTLPKDVTINDTSVQQILAKSASTPPCIKYETIDEWRARINTGTTSVPDYQYNNSRICLETGEATQYDEDFDYDRNISSRTDYYYYSYYQTRESKFEYNDLSFKNDDGTYTVTLAEPVKPKKQGSVLVAFTTSDFVAGGFFGRYDYNVKTLLTKQIIDRATVALNFDTDMYTREAEQEREYEVSPSSIEIGATASMDSASGSYESRSLDSLLGSVGRGGLYVKTQSSLLSGDTLSVKGVFGTNKTILYTKEIVTTLLLIAAVVVALVAYRRWRKKHPREQRNEATNDMSKSASRFSLQKDLGSSITLTKMESLSVPLVVSVASLLGTGLVVAALIGIASIGDDAYSYGFGEGVLVSAIIVISALGLLLSPVAYMMRYGADAVFKWTLAQVAVIIIAVLMLMPLFA